MSLVGAPTSQAAYTWVRGRSLRPRRADCSGFANAQVYSKASLLTVRGCGYNSCRIPMVTPPEVEERILAVNLEHSAWGCDRLRDWLELQDVKVSSLTIRRIPNDNQMGTRYDRWLKFEQLHSE